MSLRSYVPLVVVSVVSAGASLLATHAWQAPASSQSPPTSTAGSPVPRLTRWLGLEREAAARVEPIEARFLAESKPLEQSLAAERETLANLFEQVEVSDRDILDQVERVIAAHDALERRTARFLLAVRPLLTAEQQKRLLEHFATGVRESGGYRWRHGPPDRGPGRGRGSGGRP